MAPTAARTRATHRGPDRRRPEVLDAALSIAVRDGLSAVTIGSIATTLGVTRPVVYACYPDRVALLQALLDRESELLLHHTLAALHTATGEDPDQAFTDGYRALLSTIAGRPDSWRLVFSANPDPDLVRAINETRAVVFDAASSWIAPALRQWWNTDDLDRKLSALIELFMSSCEAAARVLLDTGDWTPESLANLYGPMMSAAYRNA